jgi:peptidoglycan/xylan/chitin deacetylase (PgdA/CDA1 family)
MAVRSAILTYHSLDRSGSVISTPPSKFREQMEFLAESGIPVVPLDRVLSQPGSVALTFDDGFRNLLDHAIPVLDRKRFPAAVFIVGGYCGRNNNWPSQPQGAPDLPLLDWNELATLPEAITLGAHTMTHPNLNLLPVEECDRELRECQGRMEQRLARPVRWMAYPYGMSSPAVKSIAGRYFDLALGTSLQFVPPRPDCLDLPRIDMFYLRNRFPLERLFTASGELYIGFRRLLRTGRRFVLR